mmetsp:Transcript_28103/g.43074  ORF Transcript_28103/g.43074 Transcript_28103/m.43074 type:complete len:417 (+) Transcript_28103:2151-3401(+)
MKTNNDNTNQIPNRIQKKTIMKKINRKTNRVSSAAKMTLNDKAKAAVQFQKRDPPINNKKNNHKMEHRRLLLSEKSNGDDDNHPTSTHKNHHSIENDDDLPPPRLIRVSDRSLFVPLMTIADGVASSAGSQLLSECIYMHMPLFALYLQGDDEQVLNIAMTRHHNKVSKKQKRYDVFGTSFEEFRSTIPLHSSSSTKQPNTTATSSVDNENTVVTGLRGGSSSSSSSTAVTYNEFDAFVETVRTSTVSKSFFESMAQTQHETKEVGNVPRKNHVSSTLTTTSSSNTAMTDAKSTTTATTSKKNGDGEHETDEYSETTTTTTTTIIIILNGHVSMERITTVGEPHPQLRHILLPTLIPLSMRVRMTPIPLPTTIRPHHHPPQIHLVRTTTKNKNLILVSVVHWHKMNIKGICTRVSY